MYISLVAEIQKVVTLSIKLFNETITTFKARLFLLTESSVEPSVIGLRWPPSR